VQRAASSELDIALLDGIKGFAVVPPSGRLLDILL